MTKDPKRQAAVSQPFFVMMPERLANDDEISLVELWRIFADGKWIILIITLIFTFGSILYAINATPIYRAEVLLAPAKNDDPSGQLGTIASQFGGLANLAGISLPDGGDIDTVIATLKSRRFISSFVHQHNLKPILFPENWNPDNKEWALKEPTKMARIKAIILPKDKTESPEQLASGEPSMWRTYSYFMDEVLTVVFDKKSGLITLRVDWKDPKLAANWGNALVEDLNNELRKQAIEKGERGVMYLKAQVEATSLTDLRSVLYRLIEEHIKTITLAKVNEQYALTVIDPAVAPQDRIRPKRTQTVLLGTFVGLMIGALVTFLREMSQGYRVSPEEASPEQGYFHFR